MTHHLSTRAASTFLVLAAVATSSCKRSEPGEGAASSIVGAYRLVSLEEPTAGGPLHPADCTGSLDEPGHRFTFHVEGALVRALVGAPAPEPEN